MTEFDDPAETWTIAVDADTSALERELKSATALGRQFGASLVDAFQGIAIKGKSVADVLRSLALRLSDLVLKAAFKPLEDGLGTLFSGLVSGGFGGGAAAPALPVPFVSGGVIQSPIAFPLARGRMGLAGERGAEAIMPLARGPDGRLGVVTAGGGTGASITFNIATPDVESFRRSETQIGAMVARAVALGQRNL